MSRWVARWSVEIPGETVDAVKYRAERVKAWILKAAGASRGAAVPESDSTVISILTTHNPQPGP